ncbi:MULTISPECIES: ATP-binding protein [unclassified Solwaraspora]|uniref:ATP-binding protein n=1 Tax=unclassified Solwaraspora TaxID=2627926 RepID=UPI00259B537F|nr:tetratricopeptide repeat protein [Solwaraspora sp. WMMA2056]WJK43579.1 tetratricopeptide repeat protein [Solwaraspora sp. WMMA2056]
MRVAMVHGVDTRPPDRLLRDAATARTVDDLAGLLRALRRRHARREGHRVLSYRLLAARAGWSHTAVAEYLTGKTLPPTDRFDVLVGLLGASPIERGALASARDRVDEQRRGVEVPLPVTVAAGAGAAPPAAPGPGPGGGDPVPRSVPRQLPPALARFSGRQAELTRLTEFADATDDDRGAGAVRVVAVSGTAGVGKTTLAVHWAHQVADRFPDGQLYLNLRGFDPDGAVTEPAAALRLLLDGLGVPPARVPAQLDAQTALLRTTLAGRRMLIVLDNARDSGHVRMLLPSAPRCLVVVTSRNQLTGLVAAHGAFPVTLDLLDGSQAAELLRHRVGVARCAAEPDAVDEIVARCVGLPLALAVVGARAATAPQMPLAALAAELRTAGERLDALAADDPELGVRSVFSWSYQALSPAAAQLFRLLGNHPGPTICLPAAASLAGRPAVEVRRVLGELVRSHLLDELADGRYGLHDLLRVYAAEQARRSETAADRAAAVRRLVDHYTHSAYQADRALQSNPVPSPPSSPAVSGVGAERFADAGAALAWFAVEQPVLVAVFDVALAAGLDAAAVTLSQVTYTFLDRRGHWRDLLVMQQAALEVARRLGDTAAQAAAHRNIARAYTRTNCHAEAETHLLAALTVEQGRGDLARQGLTEMALALLRERQERHREALAHGRTACELYEAAGDLRGAGKALNVVGWQHARLGEYAETLSWCGRALEVLQGFADRPGLASTWHSLGYAYQHLGHPDEAAACYQEALALFRGLGDRHLEALVLSSLGEIGAQTGDVSAARRWWSAAVEILDGLQHPDAEPIRARLTRLRG